MPLYEFSCEACRARFETLVPAGTESVSCPECGADRTVRVLSAPGTPMRLVKSPGAQREQERRNAGLHGATKARFKERRRRAQERRGGNPGAT